MKGVIWKSQLKWMGGQQTLKLPSGAEMLCVREQNGKLCVWYRCNPRQPLMWHTFTIAGTGQEAVEGDYLGTVMLDALVLHVFINR